LLESLGDMITERYHNGVVFVLPGRDKRPVVQLVEHLVIPVLAGMVWKTLTV